MVADWKLVCGSIVRLLLTIVIASKIAFTITGCGKKIDIDVPAEVEAGQEESEEAQEEVESEQEDVLFYTETEENTTTAVLGESGQSFSEGLAWVKFAEYGSEEERYGCIDKQGKVLFAFPKGYEGVYPTPFDNGYSFITTFDGIASLFMPSSCQSITIVDTKGDCKTFNASELGDTSNVDKEYREIVSWGGGYFVLCRHQEADFDNNGYPWVYDIFDTEGNRLNGLDSESDTWAVRYCGQGVFKFTRDSDTNNSILFFSTSGKFIQMYSQVDVVFVDGEDTAFLSSGTNMEVSQVLGEGEWQDSMITGIAFVTNEGEILTGTLPDGVQPYGENPRVSDGKIVLEGNGTIYSYDVKSGSVTKMSEEYAQRDIVDADLIFHDGVCTTRVEGADGKCYYCVYDTDWNRLFDPLEVHESHLGTTYYSDGLMAIMSQSDNGESYPSLIDKDGNVVFSRNEGYFSQSINGAIVRSGISFTNMLGSGMNILNAGVAVCSASSGYDVPVEYYDTEGNQLFDSLDTDEMKTLSFNW